MQAPTSVSVQQQLRGLVPAAFIDQYYQLMLARQKRAAAAVVFQTAWRARQAVRAELREQSIVRLQAAVRCWLVRRQYQQTRHSCLVIQAAWRAVAAGRATRLHLQALHCAAVCIQARWRGLRQRRHVQLTGRKVVMVQSAVRRRSARQAYLRSQAAATVLQSARQARASRVHLQAQHCAAVCIQARWRGLRQRRHFQLTVRKVVMVQSVVRRRSARQAAASLIQSASWARLSVPSLACSMSDCQSTVDCDSADESDDGSADKSYDDPAGDSGSDVSCDSRSAESVSPRSSQASNYFDHNVECLVTLCI